MGSLARIIALRLGEGRLVVVVAGAFGAVEMGRGLGEVGVDTLVLSRVGQAALPWLYVGLGVVGLFTTLAYGTALVRRRSERFFPALLLVLAAVLAIEWLIALSGIEAVFPALWISVYAVGMLLLTVTWTVAGAVFDARQAKRIFPLLTSSAIVGSLAGYVAAIVVQRLVGAEQLILAEALLLCGAAALLAQTGTRLRPRGRPGEPPMDMRAALGVGATIVARSPLMRWVAVAYVLLAILLFSVTFPFMTAMSEAYPDEGDLLTALALFSAVVTGASFLIGVLVANRVYARLGVATAALGLPLVYLLGFGMWLARFTTATAVTVRFAQQVTQRGISNAAWSAFFNVIPADRRGPAMAFIDGVPGQLGTVLSGVLLLIASSQALGQVFVVGLVTSVASLGVVLLIRREYAATLVATLRSGLAERVLVGGPGLVGLGREPGVLATLHEAANAGSASERLFATDLLARIGDPGSVLAFLDQTDDPDAAVRRVAVTALARTGANVAGPRLRQALADEDGSVRGAAIRGLCVLGDIDTVVGASPRLEVDPEPRVRAELASALADHGVTDLATRIVGSLLQDADPMARAAGLEAVARAVAAIPVGDLRSHRSDPDPHVRAAAIRALAAHGSDGVAEFLAGADDPALEVRAAAAAAIHARPDGAVLAMALLADGSVTAQETALESLVGREDAARSSLVDWADGQVTRATALRRHAAGLAGAGRDSAAAFMGEIVRRRASGIESRLLKVLALLGAPEASGLIRRCLRSSDPEVRAQAIEALDALGDAGLAKGVVRLLDSDASSAGDSSAGVVAAASELRHDADPWVRALALSTLLVEHPHGRKAIHAQARADVDPIVRSAIDSGEDGPMTDAIRLVSDLERMLVLRQVPIFAALSPEDLQRVAATATEQRWGAGEAIMTEGDIGSELVVIVEGSVRVVHRDAGGEHLLRRYGPGHHIGELAVLREAPRAATVIAAESGVRGLVIGGEAVHALLRERPDAAMAMLATLADRISSQA